MGRSGERVGLQAAQGQQAGGTDAKAQLEQLATVESAGKGGWCVMGFLAYQMEIMVISL